MSAATKEALLWKLNFRNSTLYIFVILFGEYEICLIELKIVFNIILLNIIKIYWSVKKKHRDKIHCKYKTYNTIFCIYRNIIYIKIINLWF